MNPEIFVITVDGKLMAHLGYFSTQSAADNFVLTANKVLEMLNADSGESNNSSFASVKLSEYYDNLINI